MRKLIHFLVRYFTVILFLLLQAAALVIIIRTNAYQQSTYFAVNTEWSGRVLASYNHIDEYLNLASTNKQLARENANLRSANKHSYFSLISKKDTLVDSLYRQQFAYLEARVINSSFNKRNNYITLDKGSVHGIKRDMAVTSSRGVVGVVKEVSAHYSTVLPLIHSRSLISVGFKKHSHFGSMSWNGKSYRNAQLNDVPREADFTSGDTLVSDTRNAAFPRGLLVGTVGGFELNPADQTYSVEVDLTVDFAALDFVYVIVNRLRFEQENLEAKTEE